VVVGSLVGLSADAGGGAFSSKNCLSTLMLLRRRWSELSSSITPGTPRSPEGLVSYVVAAVVSGVDTTKVVCFVLDSCEAVVVMVATFIAAATLSALAVSGTSVSSGGKKNSSDVMMVSTTAFAVFTSLSAGAAQAQSDVMVLLSPHARTQHNTTHNTQLYVPKYKFGLGVVLL
jgi:hypothetical protein